MTGISDVVRSARSLRRSITSLLRPFLTMFCGWLPAALCHEQLGLPSVPQPTGFQDEDASVRNAGLQDEDASVRNVRRSTSDDSWGLLLPVCCRGSNEGEICFSRLATLVSSIEQTLTRGELGQLAIFIGFDEHDVFYDRADTQCRVSQLFGSIGIKTEELHWVKLRSHYRGKICRIWNNLAHDAVEAGCSFLLLVGDDVTFLTCGWKREIETQFEKISLKKNLPFGAACVAFQDTSFPVFPTFPVIHRSHFSIFDRLLPNEFLNQHGDPFLFELYRRLGAAEFATTAALKNSIGGPGDARYVKHDFNWQGTVLSGAISKLLSHFDRSGSATTCLNVVVPTFRCDMKVLRQICSLTTSGPDDSVHFLLVVDNPEAMKNAELAEAVTALQDYTPNHLVRVHRNHTNIGAGPSRNVGIASSCGDWIVLLDDDVIPDRGLLDAYLGGIARHPKAQILVGWTELPSPRSLMEQALMASEMTFFYDVARRMKNPPWGITANLCIAGRATERVVWFSDCYPRTGGGEDVDFCLRVKDLVPHHLRDEIVVAVPEARVRHPFWNNITRQVVGWALGDVLCLSQLPKRSFYCPPNAVEFIFLFMVKMMLFEGNTSASLHFLFKFSISILAVETALTASTSYPNTSKLLPRWKRLVISCCSEYPILLQDVARLLSKLIRLHFTHICLQFDWMDGQREHVLATRLAFCLKNLAWILLTTSWFTNPGWLGAYTGHITLASLLMFVMIWNSAQYYSSEKEAQDNVARLAPLDISGIGAQPFVVLSFQRSGSNLLCGRLHNHHQIVMHNEIFNKAKIWTYHDFRADHSWNWDIFRRDANPAAFLSEIFSRIPSGRVHALAVGFKLLPEHLTSANEPVLRQLLADSRVKKIILERKDVLQLYVSKLRADKTGAYLSENLDHISVHVDPASFQAFVDYHDQCYKFFHAFVNGQQVYHVTYEEIAHHRTADDAVKAILRFLGVDDFEAPRELDATTKQVAIR